VSKSFRALFCALLVLFSAAALKAQSSTASMFGNVTDATGAAVPKATVTIIQTDTQFTRTVVTEANGSYRADFLPVGPYKISVTAPGFKKLDREGITLTVTEDAEVSLALQAGGASETVEVTAEVPLLNTGNSTLGRTITNVEIDNLPLVDRNVYRLLDLTPGVQNNNAAGTGGNGGVINATGFPEQHVKINGSTDSLVGQVSYYLDGGTNMTGLRDTGNPLPNPDAIREFNVQTNNFSAQYGRNSAGVVSVLTKSGTNQFHGSAFEFFRDRNFNATVHNTASKTPYNQHRFGYTFGGPILHDKLFFFASYAGFRFISDNIFTTTVPSAAMDAGNFTENIPTTNPPPSNATKCTVGEQSATQFWACIPGPTATKATAWCPNNICPTSSFDPTILAIIAAGLIPTPNPSEPGDSVYTRRDFSPFSQKTNEQLYKGDYQMTPKMRLTASEFYQKGAYLQNPSGNNILGWTVDDFNYTLHVANIAHTWTITNNTVNQLMLNYTRLIGGRLATPEQSLASFGGSAFAEQLPGGGICGPAGGVGCVRPQLAPSAWFTAGEAITGPVAGSNVYAIRDVVSSTHGHHTLYFGGEASRENDPLQTTLNDYGVFGFTNHTNTANRSSAAITDFFFGSPNTMEQDVPVYANANYFNWGAFFQDDWRIRSNLTVNLGIRYDIQSSPTNTQNMLADFIPGQQSTIAPTLPKGIVIPGDAGVPRSGASTRYTHVSPRLGFAWTPFADGKTVVHGGMGLFYGSISGNLWQYPSNGEPFSGRPTFSHVISVNNPYATDPTDFCQANPTCIAGGVGHSPYPFIYNPASPSFVVAPAALITVDPNFRWPEIYQMNFGVQQQFAHNIALTVNFVSSLGRKLPTQWDLNYPTFNLTATGTSGASCATTNTTQNCSYANTTGTVNNRRPYNDVSYSATYNGNAVTAANPFFTSIGQIQSSESSEYNGMQVSVQKTMSHGLSIQGFYVWSKDLQSMDLDLTGNTGNTAGDDPQDNHNHHLDRQRSDYDQREVVAMAVVYKPVFGIHNKVARYAVNGWTITSIVQLQSGLPFNVTTGSDNNADGITNDRPNLMPGVTGHLNNVGKSRVAAEADWIDPSQFCSFGQTTPITGGTNPACTGAGPAGSDGTVRENTFDAPGRRDIDASIFRDFPITERVKFQLRGEATNVFNLTNLPAPTGTLTSGPTSFGHINGSITGGYFSNRIIQVGGRVLF
jgi:outer membrane receptor protein involved in Fe transport